MVSPSSENKRQSSHYQTVWQLEAPSWQTHLIQKNSLLTFSVLDEFLEELTGTLGGLRQSVQSLLAQAARQEIWAPGSAISVG